MPNANTSKSALVSARQPNGRLVPVFPSLMTHTKSQRAKQDNYIERMIKLDRESERAR